MSLEVGCPDFAAGLFEPHCETPVLLLRDSRVVAANPSAGEMLGRDVAGLLALDLVDASSRSKLASALDTGSRRVSVCEVDLLIAGHPPAAVRAIVFPTSEAEHLVLFVADAPSAQRRWLAFAAVNDELTNLSRELSRRSRELGEERNHYETLSASREHFTALLAHDLRTPLGALRLTAAMMDRRADELSPDELRACCARIVRSVERMSCLVEHVLSAIRLDAGPLQLETRPVSLAALVEDVLATLQSSAASAGVELTMVAETDRPVVTADPTWIGEVLVNLLANAIRHSPRGGTVTVRLSGRPGWVACTVADEGPGIPDVQRAELFTRYRQGRNAGAMGLGLFISRQIVERHGGRIFLGEGGRGGAQFVFELPAAE